MADENKNPDPLQPIEVTYESVKADVPTVYANNVRVGMSQWDITMELGEIQAVNLEEHKMFITPRIKVAMSPSFAHQLCATFKDFLDRYGDIQKQQQELLRKALESRSAKTEEKKS